MTFFVSNCAQFNAFAKNYNETLSKGLSVTGEGPAFYAENRVMVTNLLLKPGGIPIERILDFGCGIGTSIPFLAEAFSPMEIVGVDVSEEMLAEARARVDLARVCLQSVEQTLRDGEFNLVYSNGVFHHIRPEQRAKAFQRIFDSLRPAGYFALWENNPLNPGTRFIMAKFPFDRDATAILPRQATKMLETTGFRIETVLSRFFFPRLLAFLRPLEPWLSPSLLGGQYLVLARKPTDP
jgi:SAM-dependent methyltransferase